MIIFLDRGKPFGQGRTSDLFGENFSSFLHEADLQGGEMEGLGMKVSQQDLVGQTVAPLAAKSLDFGLDRPRVQFEGKGLRRPGRKYRKYPENR